MGRAKALLINTGTRTSTGILWTVLQTGGCQQLVTGFNPSTRMATRASRPWSEYLRTAWRTRPLNPPYKPKIIPQNFWEPSQNEMDNSTMKNIILFGSFFDVRERTNIHEKIAELFKMKGLAVVCASR